MGFLSTGALAGISSSLSDSDRSTACGLLLILVKVDAGAVTVVVAVVVEFSPLRFDAADTTLMFLPFISGRSNSELVA